MSQPASQPQPYPVADNRSEDIKKIRKILKNMSKRVKNLSSSINKVNDLETKINELSSKLSKVDSISEVKTDLNELMSRIRKLESNVKGSSLNGAIELKRDLNELMSRIRKLESSMKASSVDDELKNSLNELMSRIKKLEEGISTSNLNDELKQSLSELINRLQKLETTKEELEEIKNKIAHKHTWHEINDGVLGCKDCDATVPIPPGYTKIKTTSDLFHYFFKPHRHGETVFDDIFSCPTCKNELADHLKKRGYNVEVRGDELRLKSPTKKK